MPYRYLVLLDSFTDQASPDSKTLHAQLVACGMECRLSLSGLKLYVGKETPSLALPGVGLIVGQVFPRAGDTSSSARPPTDLHPNPEQLLLARYWGEYIAILGGRHADEPARILRDPSGGAPCIYSIDGRRGFVASNVSIAEALGLCERRVDWDAVTHSLVFPHWRSARTALRGIRELLPGCMMRMTGRGVAEEAVWSPWDFVRPAERHHCPADAATSVREAVTTAVSAWADLDRSVLLELSGGLDSSIVGACLRDSEAKVACCTLTTPLSGTDERPYARHVATLLGEALHTLHIGADGLNLDFPPPAGAVMPGMTPVQERVDAALTAAAEHHGARSFMSGAGGDTVFCFLGNASPAADAFRYAGPSAGFSAVQDISALHGCTLPRAIGLTARKLLRGPKPSRPANLAFLGQDARLTEPMPHPWLEAPRDARIGDREWLTALAGTQCYPDGTARNRFRPVRFPLLSQPVVEACLRVPTWMWVADGRNRAIARAAFANKLPPLILNRRSKGSYVPFAGLLYARYRTGMLRFLEDGQLASRNLLDVAALRAFMSSDVPPKDVSFLRIFDLCMVENWVRHQGTGRGSSGLPAGLRPPARIDRQTAY
ncbi:asparagine synthase C-terminal domain-containing protein [Luteimonas sp. RD2P54]|uniref:asparagine synthase (glutamine-hydrolyzing) n=1 Tax=Luteimonas endophytica TaxID=3042023 RepID=A0ABT6JAR3_9GAMM|nr:asparagine synthase C-terminal domain-containing protein [Luteimonas endophytica]MDH5823904.1 asparagine synthase C-terminal domain-containing protein [Luteimonas endophytica]